MIHTHLKLDRREYSRVEKAEMWLAFSILFWTIMSWVYMMAHGHSGFDSTFDMVALFAILPAIALAWPIFLKGIVWADDHIKSWSLR